MQKSQKGMSFFLLKHILALSYFKWVKNYENLIEFVTKGLYEELCFHYVLFTYLHPRKLILGNYYFKKRNYNHILSSSKETIFLMNNFIMILNKAVVFRYTTLFK